MTTTRGLRAEMGRPAKQGLALALAPLRAALDNETRPTYGRLQACYLLVDQMAYIVKPPCDDGVMLSGRAYGSTGTAGAARAVAEAAAGQIGPWVLVATILGSSMGFIDGTVVNVALPVLQAGLHATASDVQWVVESYSLFLAALILVGGSLGDHFGRRQKPQRKEHKAWRASDVRIRIRSGMSRRAATVARSAWPWATRGSTCACA